MRPPKRGARPGQAEEPKRSLEDWRQRAEDAIREAMDEGRFDNLPGEGQPFVWDSTHDDENWLAQHLLKNAGFVPVWVEDAKAISRERRSLMAELDRPGAFRDAQPVAEWRERAVALNDKIQRFNLSVPTERLQVLPVNIERELARR